VRHDGPVDRPRVVHLTTVVSSLTKLLLPQLVAFSEAGYEVIGVSAPGREVDQLEAAGIRHVALRSSTRAVDLRADLTAATDFVRTCRRLRPDIVHTHNPKPGVYGRIGARLAGVPHVVNTVHGLYAQTTDPLPRRLVVYGLERVAATFSDAELLQNVEDVPVLLRLGVPRERLHVLGNGVDLRRFDPDRFAAQRPEVRAKLGVKDDEVLVGVVGRLVYEKGYREVFHAAAELRQRRPEVRFVVIGPEDPDKGDAATASDLNEARKAGVRFLGQRDDVERLYVAMDLFVLASHREGFPRAAMEAAAMGLPVVATDIRGCRQVVAHGRTGLLVPPADADALVAAIEALASDPARRSGFGASGRSKALRDFDDRRQIALTLAVYGALLSTLPGRL
jgi:glycosyltransferase involved in cell wall biosynthesis